jgi:methanol metabolism-related c-type cytochrome
MSLMIRDIGLFASLLLVAAGVAYADRSGDPAAARMQDGEYFDSGGNPTFKIAKDGTVDWYTYSGYVRYTANCMQCHGPAGLGSSFAPSLVDALKSLTYTDFLSTVANGKKDVNAAQQAVMPAFGTNRNVMCYTDPIYVYLRARSDGAVGPLRPDKHAPKPDSFAKAEDSCMG